MLNHAIDNLTPAQEDVFLETPMIAFARYDGAGRRCYLGMLDYAKTHDPYTVLWQHHPWSSSWGMPGDGFLARRFNELCQKLEGVPMQERLACNAFAARAVGAAKLATLIRNRILSNRARRALSGVRLGADIHA